ncbi:MAG: division/cell wall cluster transcriptional repressor MraZ [Acidobacteria bacterium]|nr:division/cell wall cluster transcriptional repressor MraZ [Acidobacteriota bacterium]
MLRGNHPATVDAKGRLKVPAAFLETLKQFGTQVFITSLDGGRCVSIYPMPVWEEIESRMKSRGELDPVRRKFRQTTNFYGQVAELDAQNRLLLPQHLRTRANTVGKVDVLGQGRYLEAWDHETLLARVDADPLTEHDLALLAQEGI